MDSSVGSYGVKTRKTVRVHIQGRVQGVYFRSWAVKQARLLELDGWVRNLRDGGVELLLSGPGAQVDKMVVLCHQGPEAARVEKLVLEVSDQQPERSGFRQAETE